MNESAWQAGLERSLQRSRPAKRAARVAIVGIGNELCGDDAAGVLLARRLKRDGRRETEDGRPKTDVPPPSPVPRPPSLLVIDAGCAPENVTGALRRIAPDLVILVDAAQMDEPPGAVRWLDARDTSGLSASTHTLPLHVLARYLEEELRCAVALLAIQPDQTTIGAPVSSAVQRALDSVCSALVSMARGPYDLQ